jgi:hypothetical protein
VECGDNPFKPLNLNSREYDEGRANSKRHGDDSGALSVGQTLLCHHRRYRRIDAVDHVRCQLPPPNKHKAGEAEAGRRAVSQPRLRYRVDSAWNSIISASFIKEEGGRGWRRMEERGGAVRVTCAISSPCSIVAAT